ncbi:MAG TPA: YSC84-related protein [Syntrophales bacterium]|nr:YSC84-related protein [Syntrophales bacterium]HPI57844.1 YSC84-related protein [Syntrophales bacterium]HPN24502.1 YSC84-related protein [Syntrophales bacterium]HQM28808.1 YSC84-related protein [Syntrophales bacterium]
MKLKRVLRTSAVAAACLVLVLCPAVSSYAATAREIDVSVDVSLDRFQKEVKGAQAFIKSAKGLLILPKVIKGGFFVGGEYGEGALRIGGKSVAYYNIASASFGLTFGGQQKDIIIAFMTDEALNKFRRSENWEAGVDGNIAVLDVGVGAEITTETIKDPIVGFVFGLKGLMADASFKGSKITKLKK